MKQGDPAKISGTSQTKYYSQMFPQPVGDGICQGYITDDKGQKFLVYLKAYDIDKMEFSVFKTPSIEFSYTKYAAQGNEFKGGWVMFLGGGLAIYLNGQGTITKSTWINNSTRDEGIATRTLAELSKASSYPTRILQNSLTVKDNDDDYKATFKKSGNISITSLPNDVLAFPICTAATDSNNSGSIDNNEKGSIKWCVLRLTKSNTTNKRCNLDVVQSSSATYDDPASINKKYTNNMSRTSKTLLHDIEKVELTKEASDSVRLDLTLSSPKYANFKKNVTLKFPLNVEFNK